MNFDRLAQATGKLSQTIGSILKIVLLSRSQSVKRTATGNDEIIVLGNGPSLNQTVETSYTFLESRKKLAVNFAANTPLYFRLKPEYYVLADPHFFSTGNEAVDNLWLTFSKKTDKSKSTAFIPPFRSSWVSRTPR